MRRNVKVGVSPGRLVTVRTDTSTVLMPAPCMVGLGDYETIPAVI